MTIPAGGWRLLAVPIGGGEGTDLTDLVTDLAVSDQVSAIGDLEAQLAITADCCDVLDALEPGWAELSIVADGCEVWGGLVSVSPLGPTSSTATIEGVSRFGWLDLRDVHGVHDHSISPTTPGDWVAEILTDALAGLDFTMIVDPATRTQSINRSFNPATAPSAKASKVLADIIGKQVDVVVRGHAVYILAPGGHLGEIGDIDMSMFDGRPEVQRRLDRMATAVTARSGTGIVATSGGVSAATSGEILLIERSFTDAGLLDAGQALSAAAARVTGQRAPLVLLADGEQAWLSCEAGVSPCEMVIGAGGTLLAAVGCDGVTIAQAARVRSTILRRGDDGSLRLGVVFDASDAAIWQE